MIGSYPDKHAMMNQALRVEVLARNNLCSCESCIRIERQTAAGFERVADRARIVLERARVIGSARVVKVARGALARAEYDAAAATARAAAREERRTPPAREIFKGTLRPCGVGGCDRRFVNQDPEITICGACRWKQSRLPHRRRKDRTT
jgi:hypothetical protein